MAESSINVTEGSGKRLHTFDRTVSSVLVQGQFVLPGEYPYASYVAAPTASVSLATANDHLLQIMAGSTNHVRIRAIHVEQANNATAAAFGVLEIRRLTTAGTGGTSYTPEKYDAGDSAAGATAMTLPSSKGTEGGLLFRPVMTWRQAVSSTGAQLDDVFDWVQKPGQKPIIIPAGTSNGLCIKSTTAVASATVAIWVEFVETAYL